MNYLRGPGTLAADLVALRDMLLRVSQMAFQDDTEAIRQGMTRETQRCGRVAG